MEYCFVKMKVTVINSNYKFTLVQHKAVKALTKYCSMVGYEDIELFIKLSLEVTLK